MKSSEWAPGVLERFQEEYDFARCQRQDGSYYGTSGTCRKGAPVDAKKSVVTEKMKKVIEEGKPFAEGGFSELYMVDGKVVKVQEDAYLPDIQKEMDMQKMAADAGLAPKVYGVEQVGDDKVIIVMDPIPKGMKNPPSMDDYAPTMLGELDRSTMLAGGELYGKMLKAAKLDYDLDILLRDVRAKVDSISNFPVQAKNPVIKKATREAHSLWIQLYGDADRQTLQRLAEKLKSDLVALTRLLRG